MRIDTKSWRMGHYPMPPRPPLDVNAALAQLRTFHHGEAADLLEAEINRLRAAVHEVPECATTEIHTEEGDIVDRSRAELEQVIEAAYQDWLRSSGKHPGTASPQIATAVLDAGWRPPAGIVTTGDDVKNLPEGTILLLTRRGVHEVYTAEDGWAYGGGGLVLDEDWLPADIVWTPQEAQQ